MYFIAMLLVVKTVFFNTYLTQFVALNIRVLLILTWLLYINNLHIVSAALQCFAGLGLQYNEYLLVGYIEYAYAFVAVRYAGHTDCLEFPVLFRRGHAAPRTI